MDLARYNGSNAIFVVLRLCLSGISGKIKV